jgi:uncharacterized membrane protein SpoIIM required for sporulation
MKDDNFPVSIAIIIGAVVLGIILFAGLLVTGVILGAF